MTNKEFEEDTWETAMEELQEDIDLQLFQTEIGVYDPEYDCNTAMDSWVVTTASYEEIDAEARAMAIVEEAIPVIRRMVFQVMNPPQKI
jgi:hypothetical protein